MPRHFILLLLLSTLAHSAESKPNILFIVSEDNGPEFGCYGYPVQTPHLDKLAKEGVRFHRAYVPQAGCSQSRAAFLTGLYPHQNGQVGLATWNYSTYESCQGNMIKSLKSAGYKTGIIGKLHVKPASKFPYDSKSMGSSNFGRKKFKSYVGGTKEFITGSEKPFFLQINVPDAHRPFIDQVGGIPAKPLKADDVKPLPYLGVDTPDLRQQTASYYNCIMRLDTQVGDILKVLEESGKYDNTFIVYIGDHGADLLRGKRTSYEGGIRIPMIIKWPRKSKPSVSQHLVSTLDLYPTFMDVAGEKIPTHLPGKSLLPLVEGTETSWRKYMFTEFHLHSNHNVYPQRAASGSRFKLIHNLIHGTTNPGYAFSISRFTKGDIFVGASDKVKAAYKLMENPPEYELYDLQTDPFEFSNLADDPQYKQQLDELKQALKKWQIETKDPFMDVALAKRFFDQIIKTKSKSSKHALDYHEYMDPAKAEPPPSRHYGK